MFIADLGFYKKLSFNRSKRLAERLAPLIVPANAHILDFGAGNMYLAKVLLELLPQVSITAIDVIEDQNLDKELLKNPRVKFQVCEPGALPFAEGSFDIVIASAVMHHTPDPDFYLQELKRVLKPGGSILLVEEMYHNLPDKLYIMAEDWTLNKLKKGVPVPLNFYSYKRYNQLFKKLNLKIDYEGFIRPGFPWKHHYVFRLTKV
ncbi:MAG TPA: class I SAM-dependent methyltransferase [Bacteroidia bacterium]|nr:class I SAM-dependent methyltransferase [Bacteroidia bacterium]